jgi:hypothetical protein
MSFTDAPEFDTSARDRDGAIPRFFMDTIQDKARSEAEGVPRFIDVEMVEVIIPGDRLNTPTFIVGERHRKRWPKQYAAFKADQEAPVDGTPIDQLPGVTKSQVQELAYFHVRTIEALANLSDEQMGKVMPMGGRQMREKAQRWVKNAEGDAGNERLAAENRRLEDNMTLMKQQMEDMQRQMAEMATQAKGAD